MRHFREVDKIRRANLDEAKVGIAGERGGVVVKASEVVVQVVERVKVAALDSNVWVRVLLNVGDVPAAPLSLVGPFEFEL